MAASWLFDLVHYSYDLEPPAFDPDASVADVRQRYLDELKRADKLGFDGLFLGEYQFTPYPLTPAPNLMLAAAAQRTSRMRQGIITNVLPFRHPLQTINTTGAVAHAQLFREEKGGAILKRRVPFFEMTR